MATTNDITGDRLVSKVRQDNEVYGENLEKIFGKKKKETNGGWKYNPNENTSEINNEVES